MSGGSGRAAIDFKRVLKGAVCFMAVLLLLPLITGCSEKEQFYQGMYDGFRSADQQMQTQDPSYTPDRPPEQRQPSYQEYTKEREQILETDGHHSW